MIRGETIEMKRWVRVSIIGKIGIVKNGINRQNTETLLNVDMQKRIYLCGEMLDWKSRLILHKEQIYACFETVGTLENLDVAWRDQAIKILSESGYKDVTWEITPLTIESFNAE